MNRRVAYIRARLLDPATGLDSMGSLLTEGGRIADVGPELFRAGVPDGIEAVDCEGLCLAPGLVDLRVQVREPGDEHKETIDTASRAATAGGVTAMACLPNTDPPVDNVAVVEFIARRAREVRLVKVFAYGSVTRGLRGEQLTEMGLLREAGAVGFTDGLKAVADARVMRRALAYAGGLDALIIQHPEEPSLARDGAMNEGELSMRLGLAGIPAAAEAIMIERDMRLVALTGARYHAAHLSTADAIEVIRGAKARGLPVTCDTAPHYFALNELAVDGYRTFGKVSPPLRSEENRLAVLEAVVDGTIDAIASDHAPHDQESKRLPLAQAEPGIVGLETLLALSLELYHDGRIGLLDLLAKLTCRPADLLGLPLGRLARGAAADLVLFDLEKPGRIEVEKLRSKSKNTPFDRRPIRGEVVRTIVDGRTVYAAGG